jgi:hypothetical protein
VEYLGNGMWDTSEGSSSSDPGSIALSEALARFDIVDAYPGPNPFIIATDKGSLFDESSVETIPRKDAVRELGSSSPSPWTDWLRREHVSDLYGEKGLSTYLKMKRSDGTVRSTLRLFKTPIVGARWYVEPGGDDDRAVSVAKRFQKMLYDDMSHGWNEVLNDVLLQADYGHMVFEKVFTEYDDGFFGWKKLAPRHPMEIQEWVWDAHGGPAGVRMKSETNARGTWIDINKLLIFTFEPECGDLRGMSLLRSAYKHFYYKDTLYKIDAIQKERHGIGVPIIKLPPGFTDADKTAAEDIGRNLRTNERAHVTLPSNWDIIFAKLEGQPVNAMQSIEHHNGEIVKNILAPFLSGRSGQSSATMDDKENSLFMKSTKYVANSISEVVNMHGFRQLIRMNYTRKPKEPKLRARRIGEWDDLRTLSFALRNLVGADIIRPDDVLEAAMRAEFDLPLADPDTSRKVEAPQTPFGQGGPDEGGMTPPGPPRVGPPRQTPATNMGTGQVGTGSQRSGKDTSGGN